MVVAPPRPKTVEPETGSERKPEMRPESKPEKLRPVEAPTAPLPRTRNAQNKNSPLTKEREERGLKPGQANDDFLNMNRKIQHRQKELAGRRAYLKNFWYAVGKGLALKVLG